MHRGWRVGAHFHKHQLSTIIFLLLTLLLLLHSTIDGDLKEKVGFFIIFMALITYNLRRIRCPVFEPEHLHPSGSQSRSPISIGHTSVVYCYSAIRYHKSTVNPLLLEAPSYACSESDHPTKQNLCHSKHAEIKSYTGKA